MGEPTRLKAIAERLNVSESTVSRALNDYQDISAHTKLIVRNMAKQLDYQPNIHAKRLASGKSETIGYVMPIQEAQVTGQFIHELMAGIAKALAKYGWDLCVIAPQTTEEELAIFKKIARTRHISGLVITRTFSDDPRFQLLQELEIPFVSHGRSQESRKTAWLDVDNELAFFDMTNHLIELDHKRIAHIGGPLHYNFAYQRRDGWQRALKAHGIKVPKTYAETAELTFDGGCYAMQRLLEVDSPPTAVCCVSDVVAIGAMQALRKNGLRPGREVSLIGYDGLELGAWLDPPLTSMRQPLQSAGEKLAQILMKIVERGSLPSDNQELVRASLVQRETANAPISSWPPNRTKADNQ